MDSLPLSAGAIGLGLGPNGWVLDESDSLRLNDVDVLVDSIFFRVPIENRLHPPPLVETSFTLVNRAKGMAKGHTLNR